MIDLLIIVVFSSWCSVLTMLIFMRKEPNSVKNDVYTGSSGPVVIKNFIKDRFGNIIKKDKRTPRRGDDLAAWEAERKALED